MAYLGQSSQEYFGRSRKEDEYVGNGINTDFALTQSVSGAFATNVLVIVGGLTKDPYDDYTITGSDWKTLHFNVAPADGDKIVVVHLGDVSQFVAPSPGSVTVESLDPALKTFTSDTFVGNGAQMNFTMSIAPANATSILVMVDGVIQDPTDNYEVSGSTLTFTGPPDNASTIRVLHLGFPSPVAIPIAGTISAESLNPSIRIFNVTNLTGDGVNSTFTMNQSEPSANAVLVSIEGIAQVPGVNYNVTGNQITFTGVPAVGAAIHIRHLQMITPGMDTVPVASGGTGATTAADARTNLGINATNILPSQTGNDNFFLKTDGAGTVSWAEATGWLKATTIKTTNYVANKNELVRVDATSGAVTITLPASPTDGDLVGVIDMTNSALTNTILVAGSGGKTVEGDGTGITIDINGATVVFSYNAAANNWKIVDTPSAGMLPDQTSNNGKFLQTNGTNASWQAALVSGDIGVTVASQSHNHTGTYEPANANIQTHIGTTGNPHGTTAADVGAEPANANIAKLNVQQEWSKPQRPSLQTETAPNVNALTWDLTDDQVFLCNLNANITTFNLTGTLSSLLGYQYQFVVRYNGGTAITWNANMKFEGGTAPTLTGTSGKLDIFNFTVASTDGGTTCYLYCTGMSQNL